MFATALLTKKQTRDQKRFTVSGQVAADWHELMIPQRTTCMWSSIARVSEQLDPRFVDLSLTTTPISHPKSSPRSSESQKLLLISRPAEDRRLR